MDTTTDISLDDLSSLKCFVTWSIGWFLGFTLVLCWSIWQLPDAQGCGIKAAWVPDAFCREACLIVRFPSAPPLPHALSRDIIRLLTDYVAVLSIRFCYPSNILASDTCGVGATTNRATLRKAFHTHTRGCQNREAGNERDI